MIIIENNLIGWHHLSQRLDRRSIWCPFQPETCAREYTCTNRRICDPLHLKRAFYEIWSSNICDAICSARKRSNGAQLFKYRSTPLHKYTYSPSKRTGSTVIHPCAIIIKYWCTAKYIISPVIRIDTFAHLVCLLKKLRASKFMRWLHIHVVSG